MAMNSQQVGWLLKMIQHTQEIETSCPECAAQLDRYAQRILDGDPVDGDLELVKHHLAACSGCEDELQMILEALAGIEDST